MRAHDRDNTYRRFEQVKYDNKVRCIVVVFCAVASSPSQTNRNSRCYILRNI